MSANTSSPQNPLSYTGIDPKQQPRFLAFDHAPLTTDYLDFNIGDTWLDFSQIPPVLHVLLSVENNIGTWQQLSSSSVTFLNNRILIGDGSSTADQLPLLNDGELVIGNTGNTPTIANLIAGSGISILNGPGSITINADLAPSTIVGFVPTLSFGGTDTGITYGIQQGYYIASASILTVDISITLTSKGSAIGNATIENLPFNITNPGANYFPLFNGEYANFNLSLGSKVSGRGISGTSSLNIYNSLAPNSLQQLTDIEFSNTSEIKFSGSYVQV